MALRFLQVNKHFPVMPLILTLLSTAANPYTVAAYLPDHPINGLIINAGGGSTIPRALLSSVL
jgi:hypothetical protein